MGNSLTHIPVHSMTPTNPTHLDRASRLSGITSPSALLPMIDRIFALTRSDPDFGRRALALADRLFRGDIWKAHPINLRYHDFAHTLQASYTFLDLVAGHTRSAPIKLTPREVELGLAAILLHDSGYLKLAGDDEGTGAKYTYSHVLRSCALAASLLPTLGCRLDEIELVVGAIRCTGINGNPATITFNSDNARIVGCMIATADYLGQMAAPEYPDKLPSLFNEFAEADQFSNVPPGKRAFPTVEAMLDATPGFWAKFVRPKLDADFGGVYRYLAETAGSDANPYFTAVEQNLAVIKARRTPAA